jgi:hypothetical protein
VSGKVLSALEYSSPISAVLYCLTRLSPHHEINPGHQPWANVWQKQLSQRYTGTEESRRGEGGHDS